MNEKQEKKQEKQEKKYVNPVLAWGVIVAELAILIALGLILIL